MASTESVGYQAELMAGEINLGESDGKGENPLVYEILEVGCFKLCFPQLGKNGFIEVNEDSKWQTASIRYQMQNSVVSGYRY